MSAAALGKPKSEATRKAMSEAKKGKPGHPQTDRQKQLLSQRRKGVPWSPEQRAKMVGRNSHRWGVSPTHAKREWYKGISFRSSWEVRVAKALDARGVEWSYEPKRFDLGECTYLPDFYLPEDDAYGEVKGWFDDKAQRKASLFRSLYPETPLVVLTKHVLRFLEN